MECTRIALYRGICKYGYTTKKHLALPSFTQCNCDVHTDFERSDSGIIPHVLLLQHLNFDSSVLVCRCAGIVKIASIAFIIISGLLGHVLGSFRALWCNIARGIFTRFLLMPVCI